MAYVLKPRRGKKATLEAFNPVLQKGEICLELPNTGAGTGLIRVKVGDGITSWNNLPYAIDYDTTEYVKMIDKGAPFGVAPLNGSRLIDSQYLPSFVDDVLEFPTFNDFPEIGEKGKIYLDASKTENNVYRWGGSQYFLIAKSVQYEISKSGSSVVLTGSDGSTSSVSNVGGVEIRHDDPSGSELYPGKMWINLGLQATLPPSGE